MSQISSLNLPESLNLYRDIDNQPLSFLQPLSKINIFVGSNNSGKSRLMRLLAMQPEDKVLFSDIDLDEINSHITNILARLTDALQQNGFESANDLDFTRIKGLQSLPQSLSMSNDNYHTLRDTFVRWANFSDVSSWKDNRSNIGLSPQDRGRRLKNAVCILSKEAITILDRIPIHSQSTSLKKVYIPVLRGLRPLA